VNVDLICSSEVVKDQEDSQRNFHITRVLVNNRYQYEMFVRTHLALKIAKNNNIFVNGLESYVAPFLNFFGKRYLIKVVGDSIWERARNLGLTEDKLDPFQSVARKLFPLEYERRFQLLNKASKVVVPSQYLADLVKSWGIKRDRIKVILNGSDLVKDNLELQRERRKKFLDENNQFLKLIFAGRLTNWKGVETLLLAASALRDQGIRKKIVVDIIGDGPLLPLTKSLNRQLRLEEIVSIKGKLTLNETRDLMSTGHVLVLTSLYEGLSHTIIDALALGIPVIASNVCGNPELIHDQENGFLVAPEKPMQIVDKIQLLLKDDELGKNLSEAALLSAQKFNFQKTLDSYLELFKEVY
jgi:glycosyltransferase involved in cell wall biosynthesis